MTRLEYYMYNFNVLELKSFLGNNLTELLIEWLPEGQPVFTEENLINMISSIYGNKILDNKDFRKRLLRALERETILSFRDILGISVEENDLKTIIDKILIFPWAKNDVSVHLLQILEIDSSYFDKIIDNRQAVEVVNTNGRFYELLDYQFTIKQKVLTYINSDNEDTKMIVRMPTGTGKTKTTMHTIINQHVFFNKKQGLVIWIAHTKELLDQAYDTFCNVWGHIGSDDIKTYKMWDKFDVEKEQIDNGFMFCGIQKLASIYKSNKTLFELLVDKISIVVVDEAHRASADKSREIINELMNIKKNHKALIGLTATPGRSSDTDSRLFRYMFDNKIIDIDTSILNSLNMSKVDADNADSEMDIIKYFQGRGILAQIEREKLEYGELSAFELSKLRVHVTSNGYKDFSEDFLKTLAVNKKRNTKIVNRLIELNNEHIPTIVFACSVEHGKMLSAALTMQEIKNGHVFGDMDAMHRKTIITRFKDRNDDLNILINYEVLTTGFDSTNIQCVFITRPTNSVVLYSQMLGRGLRGPMMGGNLKCKLIDIEDNLSKYNTESDAFNYFNNYWE